MFEAQGKYRGQPAEIRWDDGELSGTLDLVEAVRDRAFLTPTVGPVGGPYTTADHLASPLSAMVLIAGAFDRPPSWSGDVPEVPDVPPGAIA